MIRLRRHREAFRGASQQPRQPQLEKLVGAITESAQTARNVLGAMLAVALTITATMIATTDEAIFRDGAEIFPSLGVRIKLSTAYALIPPVFVFLHLNALLQLRLLAERLRAFEAQMRQDNFSQAERRAWRRLIHGFAFAQLLAGTETNGTRNAVDIPHRLLLAFVSWLAIAAIPIMLLVTVQVSFVRFQSNIITAIHQVFIAVDLSLLLWFHFATYGWTVSKAWTRRSSTVLSIGAAAVVTAISLTQAVPPPATTHPGSIRNNYYLEGLSYPHISDANFWKEFFDKYLKGLLIANNNLLDIFCGATGERWVCRYVDISGLTAFQKEIRPELITSIQVVDDNEKIYQENMLRLNLNGRAFRFANFSGAQLFSAYFGMTDARGASFDGTILIGAELVGAKLDGASLEGALLEGATLDGSSLMGANLRNANLQGASLRSANLAGATLDFAQLAGADLESAELFGASLASADLSMAIFSKTDIRFSMGSASTCKNAIYSRKNSFEASRQRIAKLLHGSMHPELIGFIARRMDKATEANCNGTSFDRFPSINNLFSEEYHLFICSNIAAARRLVLSWNNWYLDDTQTLYFRALAFRTLAQAPVGTCRALDKIRDSRKVLLGKASLIDREIGKRSTGK